MSEGAHREQRPPRPPILPGVGVRGQLGAACVGAARTNSSDNSPAISEVLKLEVCRLMCVESSGVFKHDLEKNILTNLKFQLQL